MYRYALFDLDGTLTDPKEGICKSVQFALHSQGIEEPNLDVLEPFIGPPLKDSFCEFYHMSEEKALEAVDSYRERFSTIGLYENELYPGMKELLENLKAKGIKMAIASSKPLVFVEKILKHFEIYSYFDVITGSDINGKKVTKIDVMEDALAKLFQIPVEKLSAITADEPSKRLIPLKEIVMIGDRHFDIEGAKHFHVDSIGVSYGYALEGELKEAGATHITDDLEEIYQIITDEVYPKKELQMNSLQRCLYVITPLIYTYAVSLVIIFLLQVCMDYLFKNSLKIHAGFLLDHSSEIAVYIDAIATLASGIVAYGIYKRTKKKEASRKVKTRINKTIIKFSPLIVAAGCLLGLFFNLLMSYFQMFINSDQYEQVASVQYSIPVFMGLIIYGFLKPIVEELIYRGLIYGRMRVFFGMLISVCVQAFVFGASHGNLVQLIYAFLMGCILAALYERYRSIKASVIFHSSANIFVYLLSMYSVVNQDILSPIIMIVLGILSAGSCLALLLNWEK